STSNTSPRAGVTLGAAISFSASRLASIIAAGLDDQSAAYHPPESFHAQARSRNHRADQRHRLPRALRPGGAGPLVSPARATGGAYRNGREPGRVEARRMVLAAPPA